jgi:tetrahydromethanopterin S-methyltransferase subunit C
VATDLSTLIRQELALAKAEVKQEVTQAGKAAGLFGVGAVAGLMVLVFLSAAALFGLANVVDGWLAALIVAVVWAVIGAVAALLGARSIRHIEPPERTIKTVKEDVEWVKNRAR